MRRRLLGKTSRFGSRTHVYLAEGAIEVDEMDGYTGTRKRVLFDEVLLITWDRRRRLLTLLASAALTILFAVTGALIGFNAKEPLPGVIVFALVALPALLYFILHIALGVDSVTVFGKRVTAQMTFRLRKQRARATFELLQDRVAEAQERERQRISALSPQPIPVMPQTSTDAA